MTSVSEMRMNMGHQGSLPKTMEKNPLQQAIHQRRQKNAMKAQQLDQNQKPPINPNANKGEEEFFE